VNLHIRLVNKNDIDDLIQLTLLAFEPIFNSFAQILGAQIYPVIYPDWKTRQRDLVEAACKSEKINVWVAELNGIVVGLIAYELHDNDKNGEVQFLATHPEYQNDGIGTELNNFALQKMQEAGMIMAVVGTGGDESHAPARRSYKKAGYTALPLVRFYKKL
jgi:ribosomal protein S18 acetylase RimI-like enzyme